MSNEFWIKKVEVYSFAKEENKNDVSGLMDGAMKMSFEISNPINLESEKLEDKIKFLKELGIKIGPRRFYLLHGFDREEGWDQYEEDLKDFLNGNLEDKPDEPDHDCFMLPFNYQDTTTTKQEE